MSKSKKKTTGLNFDFPPDLDVRFNAYLVKVVQAQGGMPFGFKTTVALMALKEWLDKHENDPNIDFSRPTGNRKH